MIIVIFYFCTVLLRWSCILTDRPVGPGGPCGPCGPTGPWYQTRKKQTVRPRRQVDLLQNHMLLLAQFRQIVWFVIQVVFICVCVFSAPHLLLDPTVPGFLAVLGRPSLQCLLVDRSDLSDHHDPAEMTPMSLGSKSNQGQSECLCTYVFMHVPCLPSCHGLPLVPVVLVDPEKIKLCFHTAP